jgi:hypothetical protein
MLGLQMPEAAEASTSMSSSGPSMDLTMANQEETVVVDSEYNFRQQNKPGVLILKSTSYDFVTEVFL